MFTRYFGTPVEPPVSKTETGCPSSPFGIHRRTGPPLSHSSWKWPSNRRSSYPPILSRGSKSRLLANSSQKGHPVAGSKCHCTMSRTCASSFSFAVSTFFFNASFTLLPFNRKETVPCSDIEHTVVENRSRVDRAPHVHLEQQLHLLARFQNSHISVLVPYQDLTVGIHW